MYWRVGTDARIFPRTSGPIEHISFFGDLSAQMWGFVFLPTLFLKQEKSSSPYVRRLINNIRSVVQSWTSRAPVKVWNYGNLLEVCAFESIPASHQNRS